MKEGCSSLMTFSGSCGAGASSPQADAVGLQRTDSGTLENSITTVPENLQLQLYS